MMGDADEAGQTFLARRRRRALPEDCTGHDDAARLSARALVVEGLHGVVVTAEEAQVLIQAAAQLHASIHGRLDHDHFTGSAARLELLSSAVI